MKLCGRISRQQFGARSKESFDAALITNTNLNVALGVEACPFIERLSLDEHGSYRIVGRTLGGFVVLMQEFNHGAIEVAQDKVLGVTNGFIRGHRQFDPCQFSDQRLVALLDQGQWSLFQQIEAVTEIYDRTPE